MDLKPFLSTADQFGQTRLNLDLDTASLASVFLIRNGVERTILECEIESLFTIRFTRHDLVTPANNHPGEPFNDHPFGAIEYRIRPGLNPTKTSQTNPDGSLSFIYKGLAVSDFLLPRDPAMPALPAFGPIDVTLTFSRSDQGWIDLDLTFTYPVDMDEVSSSIAWETRLTYPQIAFKNSASVEGIPLTSHELLFPGGPLGTLADVHANVLRNKLDNGFGQLIRIQYAALHKRSKVVGGINNISGLALSSTDEIGQRKDLVYQRNSDFSRLKNLLSLPIHLLTLIDGKTGFVRPKHVSDDKPAAFTLSRGDANGFRGAVMKYRLRAFQVDGVCADARVGWVDAASVYRNWVMTRQPSFFKKPARTTHGPVDKLSPFTIISNYALDGQAVGPDQGRPVHQWLEVHPVDGAHPDTGPDNANASLEEVLTLVRQQMESETNWVTVNTSNQLASRLAGSCRQPNLINLFARSKQNTLLHCAWTGSIWRNWEDLGGSIKDTPASVSWNTSRVDVFARGGNNLLRKSWSHASGWTQNWEDVGQPKPTVNVTMSPAVASRGANRLDCFVRGSDGAIWHRAWTGSGWQPWNSWGSPRGIASAPAAVAWSENRVDCLVRGNDNSLYLRALHLGVLSNWFSLEKPVGVDLQSDPAIASWASGRLDVFAWGTDNRLWHRSFNGERWTDWEQLAHLTSAPCAVSWGRHRVDYFMLDGETVKQKWLDQEASLEAQIWGFEMGGFYHYLGGFPPVTNVVSSDNSKFRRALDSLTSQRIVPSITTDPLAPLFNRGRFRGHLRRSGTTWNDSVTVGFPERIARYKEEHDGKGPITVLKINGQPDDPRVFLVKQNPLFGEHQPNVKEAEDLVPEEQRHDPWGPGQWSGALSNRFYNAAMRPICANEVVANKYLTEWTHQVFAQGARLVEFMKVIWGVMGCYHTGHTHLVSVSPSLNEYDNVMGQGAWPIQRLIRTWQQLRQKGAAADASINKSADPSFALTCEGAPFEMQLPYVDEFYHRNLLFQYVYSSRISPKMSLTNVDSYIHPGYQETPVPGKVMSPANQLYMMLPERDDEAPPSFEDWKTKSEEIATYFNIRNGLQPIAYPTDPNDSTSTYTYRRCVQDYFNLRSAIFNLGTSAVLGERILLNSTWLEAPNQYLAEAIAFAVKAAKLHQTFREFFREGYWLGTTAISQGQQLLWAWNAPFRQFRDVDPLVRKLYEDHEVDGDPDADPPVAPIKLDVFDFISRATDKQVIRPVGKAHYEPEELVAATLVSAEKIQQNIWQLDGAFGRELLYVFANVGNSAASGAKALKFQYSRGLEGQTPPDDQWKRTIYEFSGSGRNSPLTTNRPTLVRLGDWETVSIPERSLLAIRVTRL